MPGDPAPDPIPGRPFVTTPLPEPIPRRSNGFYGRLVVIIVLASVALVTFTAYTIGEYLSLEREPVPVREAFIGSWGVLVSGERPPTQLLVLALIGIALIAFVALSFETIASLMTISPRRRYLEALRGADMIEAAPGVRVRVTVLVPAHNEEQALPVTLAALASQTRQPDRVIVIADNCTDRTAEIAREMGHEAFETVNNRHKKGGALNQALGMILPMAGLQDVILVMDADTSLGPEFIEAAAARLEADPELAAVGGVFYGDPGGGVLGQFQRNEYTRYSLQIRQRRGRVFVLTGTATMFRADALLDVAAARGVFIPGEPGKVYDTAALTEDNELTLALKSLGATMVSPPECYVVTEIMPTWRNLWKQRQRWQRGALENLSAYGFTAATLRYWGQQVGIGYGTVALNCALVLMLITVLAMPTWIWFPFWTTVGAVFLVERVSTVWKGGWRARGLAALLLPELAYDVFLQAVFINSLWNITTGREARWGHVEHRPADGTAAR
jgi:cellulose synthase/poly-beta-1,6-N-acetylglucosamine synthase-like glycosyltransferase